MQTLWDKGMKVSWWNLQCYAGGSGNRKPISQPWIDALGKVVGKAKAAALPGAGSCGQKRRRR